MKLFDFTEGKESISTLLTAISSLPDDNQRKLIDYLNNYNQTEYRNASFNPDMQRITSDFCVKCNTRLLSEEKYESLCGRCNSKSTDVNSQPAYNQSYGTINSRVENQLSGHNQWREMTDRSLFMDVVENTEESKTLERIINQVVDAKVDAKVDTKVEMTDKALCCYCNKLVSPKLSLEAIQNKTKFLCDECLHKNDVQYNVPKLNFRERIKLYCVKCNIECSEKDQNECRGLCSACYKQQNYVFECLANSDYMAPAVKFSLNDV
jgi:hypothetical protein